ncbi:flagellar hook assembly protein FlgD [Shumkonia mesophila]|uniref:flagellar hook assembly protein FlgD n=1 Tax=Shumkonia mesophila TaxID=2838854 RepID=UPI0029345307|nr:flagellar hook assembly protein FlgD [Shumkonia mesophila]
MTEASRLSVTSAQPAKMTSQASRSPSSNYDTFLRLLATQLKTQNPLNPVDSTKFTEQLATFSALEQQITTNKKLDSVLSQFKAFSITNAAGHIGKTVTAIGNTFAIGSGGTSDTKLTYSLSGTAKDVNLSIADGRGNIVWSGKGETSTGNHDFVWNGKDIKGKTVPPGDYTLKVAATDANGKAVATTTTLNGKVTAVVSGQGITLLEIGNTKVDQSAVIRMTA